ncbi:hypothetical protein [Deinococcus apachensis]|uniref:hypothetical protein n=1 Tax=Deinococcus apachensis TaxID=309886 RepID=UPI00035D8EBF|nr:hypothetical protein [Deinococcus apachensis]
MPSGEGTIWLLPDEVRQAWHARVLEAWRENVELRGQMDTWRDWLGIPPATEQ